MVEEHTLAAAASPPKPPVRRPAFGENWHRALIFGTAAAIELGERDLQAVIVRARPRGATVTARITIADFRTRPPKEWGTEYHKWLRQNGERNLSSVIVLPRREAIVRVVPLPGVAKKDIANAIGYQVDALHPYGDEEVAFGWSSLNGGNVLLGMMRRVTLENYVQLFQDAGIPSSGFTFSASALRAALHLYGKPPAEFLAYAEDESGVVEVYGQSAARPVFSAEFHLPPARALALARAELRLTPTAVAPGPLADILPKPIVRQAKIGAAVPALAFAGALAHVGSRRNPYANLLPAERRTIRSRARFIPTIVLGLTLAIAGGGWLAYQQMREQQYLDEISSEIRKVQPTANKAAFLDKTTEEHRARIKLIDDYRKRGQGFVEVMAELTRLLPPPIWTQSIEITQDTVTISGEAENAATLLKILDASPIFRNSELMMGVMRVNQAETFRIRMQRKPRK